VENRRIEDIDPASLACDSRSVVTARALAPLPELLRLAFPFLEAGAQGLFLKGRDVEKELTLATRYWNIDAEQIPSLTDSAGVVLKVREIERV
jgi:16S rRNA (guanine527-N7)-methyltransferase